MKLTQIRTLDFIFAGSGLLMDKDSFYVIADDEHELVIFSRDGGEEQLAIRLIEGQLPEDHKERKKRKPDHEAMVWFQASSDSEERGILVLPSGSKPNRRGGNWFLNGTVKAVSCEDLYLVLENKIPSLNIEGATVHGRFLFLFHRGNDADSKNAIIKLQLDEVQKSIHGKKPALQSSALKDVQVVDLGTLKGSPFGFTDATADAWGRIWFLAAAENTQSTYDDGQFLGAVLGCLNAETLQILGSFSLEIAAKPEGLCLHPNGRTFYVVTDADDRSQPALLFEGVLPILSS